MLHLDEFALAPWEGMGNGAVSRFLQSTKSSRVPRVGVTGTGWHEDSHRVILIGITTSPMRNAMAKTSMDLLELLRKRGMDGDVDFLREALQVLVEGIMDAAVSAQIGAQHGERNPDRLTHCNGYRSRDWDTRVGTMELRIPKVREGSYFPPPEADWNPGDAARKLCSVWCNKPTLRACPPGGWMIWSSPWAAMASRKARCHVRLRRTGSTPGWRSLSLRMAGCVDPEGP